jgi:hypothetical protein
VSEPGDPAALNTCIEIWSNPDPLKKQNSCDSDVLSNSVCVWPFEELRARIRKVTEKELVANTIFTQCGEDG